MAWPNASVYEEINTLPAIQLTLINTQFTCDKWMYVILGEMYKQYHALETVFSIRTSINVTTGYVEVWLSRMISICHNRFEITGFHCITMLAERLAWDTLSLLSTFLRERFLFSNVIVIPIL